MEKSPNLKIENVKKIKFASVQSVWIPNILDWYVYEVSEAKNAYHFDIQNRITINNVQINLERYKDADNKYEMWGWNMYTQLPMRTMLSFESMKDMKMVITMMAVTLDKMLKRN